MNGLSPLRRHAWAIGTIGAVLAAASMAGLAGALFLFVLFDAVLPARSEPLLGWMLGLALFLLAGQAGLRALAAVIADRLARSLREGASLGDGARPAALAFFRGKGLFLLADLVSAPLFLAAILLLSRELASLALAALVLMIGLRLALRAPTSADTAALRSARRRLEAQAANAETGLSPRGLARRIGQLRLAEDDAGAAARAVERRFRLASGLIRDGAHAAMLALGAYLVIEGRLSLGGLVAIGLLTMRFLGPLRAYLLAPPPLGRVVGELRAPAAVPVAPGEERRGGELVVSGFTEAPIRLGPGGLLLATGGSGTGKTRLLRAMVGMGDDPRIRLDGAPPSALPPELQARELAYVGADTVPPAGTIAEALSGGTVGWTEDVLRAAAEQAGLLAAIRRLPDGFATRLGPRGAPLPHRAARRLVLARARARNPRLLVLDDPLIGLGEEDEKRLVAWIDEARRGGAIVVLAMPRPRLDLVPDARIELDRSEGPAPARLPRAGGLPR